MIHRPALALPTAIPANAMVIAVNRITIATRRMVRQGRGYTSAREPRGVAQLVEHRSPKPGVAGSSPVAPVSPGVEIRRAEVERDSQLIRRIDTSFETATIFEVQRAARGFRLVEQAAAPPVVKRFPLDDLSSTTHEWEQSWLALDREQPVGVVATQHDGWNKRVVVWHLYVDAGYRRRGIGRCLLETALDAGREAGMRTAWLETSNLNVPGVRAYERLGFELCGLDTSLYVGTAAEGEVSLFLCRGL